MYKRRFLVLSIVALSTLISIVQIFSIKPQYQATTHLMHSNASQYIALFDYIDKSFTEVNLSKQFKIKLAYMEKNFSFQYQMSKKDPSIPEKLFSLFFSKLQSKNNILSFLEESGEINRIITNSSTDSAKTKINLLNQLSKNFSVKRLRDKTINLTTSAINPETSINENKAYLEYTNKQVLNEIALEQKAIIQRKIKILEQEINKENNEVLESNINQSGFNYKMKQSELKRLKSLSFDMSNISNYSIDGTPSIEIIAMKPAKKGLIILMGFMLGLMLSILFVIMKCQLFEFEIKELIN